MERAAPAEPPAAGGTRAAPCPPQTPRSRAKPSLRFLLHKTQLLPDSSFPPFLGKAVFLTASLLALLGPEGSVCSVLGRVGGGRHPRRRGLLVLVWYPNHAPMASEPEDPVLTKRTWLPGGRGSQLRFVKSHTKAQLKSHTKVVLHHLCPCIPSWCSSCKKHAVKSDRLNLLAAVCSLLEAFSQKMQWHLRSPHKLFKTFQAKEICPSSSSGAGFRLAH